MIDTDDKLFNITQQCELLDVPRSSFYYEPIPLTAAELELMERFERFHFEHPFYGSRRMAVEFGMSRTKAARLMRDMHIVATYPKKRTTIPNSEHTKFPYLLRGVVPQRPNHIWSTDITYIALSQGFMYLTAIIDWYSRMILSWRLSNTMDVNFCVECLQDALDNFDEPEFFNSDQGSQYTSEKFLRCFAGHATKNSMDGKGRWVDNVIMERFWWTAKYEHIHLRGHESVD
ncbi:MAG: IS3 family transposase, partial [Planctomycetaceae bacterium]|nr:IS3 family transposase [Planctomycetaceae bacterium]